MYNYLIMNIISFEKLDSTNTYCKLNLDKLADKTVVSIQTVAYWHQCYRLQCLKRACHSFQYCRNEAGFYILQHSKLFGWFCQVSNTQFGRKKINCRQGKILVVVLYSLLVCYFIVKCIHKIAC